MVTIGEKYVERVEKAIVETLVLHEISKQPNLNLDTIVTRVRAVPGFDEKVDRSFVEGCVSRLDRDGHLEEADNRYSITDDGREDVHKIEAILRGVSNVILTTGSKPGLAGTPGALGAGGVAGSTSGTPGTRKF